ncbi:hypothetical protein [Denitratisoma sp. agr-D3]
MEIFSLPPLDGADPAAFANAAEAKTWLAALPLTDPTRMRDALTTELGKLNRRPLDPAQRLAVLDTLRKAVAFAQEEAGKRYSGKALPLAATEQAHLDGALALRRACLTSALHCLAPALAAGDPAFAAQSLQRAASQYVSLLLETLRGGQLLPHADWAGLHRLLVLAEERQLTTTPVADPQRHGDAPTSVLAAYGEAVLLHTAGLFELSPRQLTWTARWARRWGAKLVLARQLPTQAQALPLALDLAGDQPPRHLPWDGPGARLLLTHALRDSIKSRLALLGQGRSPADLQLGDDCPAAACEPLLKLLYGRWCKGIAPRCLAPRPTGAPGPVLTDGDSLFFHLSGGRSLRQAAPEAQRSIADLRRDREQMALFGNEHRAAPPPVASPPPPVEEGWLMTDDSALTLRLARPLGQAGTRALRPGQLLALQPPGGSQYLLASVAWLRVDVDDGGWLVAGARLLPGPASAAPVKGEDDPQAGWRAGYFLPRFAPGQEEESLVVPAGTFRPRRVLQLRDGKTITLLGLLERGDDYERVSYQPS